MPDNKVIPWHQYAVISYTAAKAEGGPALGKTAMQKLIYLMQELHRVPVGYRFRLYTYGPYSSDLAEDLTYVEYLGGLTIHYEPAQNTYKIRTGRDSNTLVGRA